MSSASIVVRRDAIEGIGLIDEEYFIYSDETDWQYRLWRVGWQVWDPPQVTTVHFGGGSFQPGGRRYTLVYRGRMLFARQALRPPVPDRAAPNVRHRGPGPPGSLADPVAADQMADDCPAPDHLQLGNSAPLRETAIE